MFVLLVEIEARSGLAAELEETLSALVALAQDEPDTLFYAVHRSQDKPGNYLLYEYYKDRTSWETHLQSAPVATLLKRFESLLATAPSIRFLDPLYPTAARLPRPEIRSAHMHSAW